MTGSETQVYIKLRKVGVIYSGRVLKVSSVYILFTSRPTCLRSIPYINFVINNCKLYYEIYEIKNYCSVTTHVLSSYEW